MNHYFTSKNIQRADSTVRHKKKKNEMGEKNIIKEHNHNKISLR